jgi:hypothetical protein
MPPPPAATNYAGTSATPLEEDAPLPEPPQNTGEPLPFSVLSKLFDKLQNERKLDTRMKLLSGWFTVSAHINRWNGV